MISYQSLLLFIATTLNDYHDTYTQEKTIHACITIIASCMNDVLTLMTHVTLNTEQHSLISD